MPVQALVPEGPPQKLIEPKPFGLFGGISRAKLLGYPAKKFGFPGFQRTYRTFGPPPLHVEDAMDRKEFPQKNVRCHNPRNKPL